MSYIRDTMEDVYYDRDIDLDENLVDHHAMTNEHIEILGQFLDYTGVDPERLKRLLVQGYVYGY